MTLRICLINQKGGCGKSSICFHLSGQFARMGLRVLLIDCDPQASLSQGLLGSEFVESFEPGETLTALFDGGVPSLQPISTPIDGLFLVPANLHLAQFNAPQPESSGLMQQALRSFVDACSEFDIVLFDCPPNLYQCS